MLNFDFHMPTRIVFGKDTEKEIGNLLKPYAKKILLHYGGTNIKKSGLYERVITSLKSNKIDFIELGGVVPNPRLSLIYEGINLCQKEKVDLILAVGGGSVIDSAKAIAMGLYYEGDVWEIFETRKDITKVLPIATILTIPASGSESSFSTVITNEKKEMKLSYSNDLLRPVLSVINPELFYTLPKRQIANGVADMISHIFERYFTNTKNNDLTDGLCEATLKTIMKNGPIVYNDPSNYDAWCQIGFSGTIAHNGSLGLGREEDWAAHKIEHELSAIYDVDHGAGLAVLVPNWMKYVYKTNPDMFVQFAVNVMDVKMNYSNSDAIISEGIERLKNFYSKLELPSTLNELKINEENFETMAKKATKFAYGKEVPLGGLKKLYWQDVLEIYKLAK
ncbi:iron-containing alcohol dehydrogenase [Selenomonadales bacterium OttesenSCG-928-I06]|nr:iron-containing alcohol dehydrogenase [Selenomonadales bacterium OttesenSCG-928-I06]